MACRVADACDQAEHTAKLEIGVAIRPRVFRHRVLVEASQRQHFEPRSGCRRESAARRAGIDRVQGEDDFPACGVATATRHAISSLLHGSKAAEA